MSVNSEKNDNIICFICEKDLECDDQKSVVNVSRGIETLKTISLERKDERHKLLIDINAIKVHVKCRERYALKKGGKFVYNYSPVNINAWKFSPVKKKLRRSSDNFCDFQNKCFICDGYERSLTPAGRLHIIQKPTFQDKFTRALQSVYNDLSKIVLRRISCVDLIAVGARYHLPCYHKIMNIYLGINSGEGSKGRPKLDLTHSMETIYNYIEDAEEKVFTLQELTDLIGNVCHSNTVESRLKEKYEDITIVSKPGGLKIIAFNDSEYTALTKMWKSHKKNPAEEETKALKIAASIIRNDYNSFVSSKQYYPPSDSILDNIDEETPPKLKFFLEQLILQNKRKNLESYKKKVTVICHAIMSAARPRTFFSMLQVALSVMLHRKFGSRRIIDIFNNLGLCSSYNEALLCQDSFLIHGQPSIKSGVFSQWVFDNADYNVNTIDGRKTFHSMGGIKIVTPKDCFTSKTNIPRLKKRATSDQISAVEVIPYEKFENIGSVGLSKIIFKNFDIPDFDINNLTCPDFLWMYSKIVLPNYPGYNGFMTNIVKDLLCQQSKIICLPFLNYSASDYNTIYSALMYAKKQADELQLPFCFVTFDQPLYEKSINIIESKPTELSTVHARLGGFHTLMSYLGCIGYIMSGSGLLDVLSVCYAKCSALKMLEGHAYARAIRGHNLVYLSLCKLILSEIDYSSEEKYFLQTFAEYVSEGETSYQNLKSSQPMSNIVHKFLDKMKEIGKRGKTAKLWISYMRMVVIAKSFLRSEKMGDIKEQLKILAQMIPYFHAAGHFHYAKCAHVYIQKMTELAEKLTEMSNNSDKNNATYKLLQDFFLNGFNTGRRADDNFWSGVFTDMLIEQDLMRILKIEGGMIGRTIMESTLARWILAMPYTNDVCKEIETFCGIKFSTSEQHVDTRDSRIKRDNEDILKMFEFFKEHDPFPHTTSLISISTGVTGGDNVNCYDSFEIGKKNLHDILGKTFTTVTFPRSKRVLPLSTTSSCIKSKDNSIVAIDPNLLFQRMIALKKSDEKLQEYFQYELAPYPMSIFNDGLIRKTPKAALYDLFVTEKSYIIQNSESVFVIDGGMLLHRVRWSQNQSVQDIIGKYILYLKSNFESDVIIVFDGYTINSSSTKSAERLRRSNKASSTDILFNENMDITVQQDKFFGNNNNKSRFIKYLTKSLEKNNYIVKQAEDDADTLVVKTALEVSCQNAVIVSEDTDILILMIALTPSNKTLYFLKLGKQGKENTVYSSKSLDANPFCKENILFLHAFTGCDTTSCFYNKGKKSIFNYFETNNNDELQQAIHTFYRGDADKKSIFESGIKCLLHLYRAPKSVKCINLMRYISFSKAIIKPTPVNLANLPPTSDAAQQHFFRVYYQIQQWLSKNISPENWGWKKEDLLVPVTMTQDAAPLDILNIIFCNCKTGCKKSTNCSCIKAGLPCSVACGHCQTGNCNNSKKIDVSLDESDDEDDKDGEKVFDELNFEGEL